MALGDSRVHLIGETPYLHEQEGIDYARGGLPNADPYQMWALAELVDPSSGHLHEVDLIILGHSALYLVELKAHPGRITGDGVDWWWHRPDGSRGYMEPPLKRINLKAKIFKGLLRRYMHNSNAVPRVEGLVFMSAQKLKLDLDAQGLIGVVTRATFRDAITQHKFPGSPPGWAGRRIGPTVMRDIAKALGKMGIRPRKGKMHAGSYELGVVIAEGQGYQDRVAVHRQHEKFRGRARTYLVPTQSDPERRQRLFRAAERESQLLYDVREHGHVLRINDYVTDAPLGPTMIFDEFEGGVLLETFLRSEPDLDFDDRVQLVVQIGRALAHCHKNGVFHGALSPEAILVRRHPDTKAVDSRLFNFQLGQSSAVDATSHWSALSSNPSWLYRAPELEENPRHTAQSDLYSLGAVAHLVFTGRPPGADIVEIYTRLKRDGFLDPQVVLSKPMQDSVADAICEATHRTPATRVGSVDDWVEYFEDAATAPDELPIEEIDPLTAKKGDVLGGDLRVLDRLGQGASARVLEVENTTDDRRYALKVSLSPEHDERLEREAEGLLSLEHPRIVRCYGTRKLNGRTCVVLSVAGNTTLQELLLKEGTVSLDLTARYGTDLLDALQHLEESSIVHRDIKPANLGVGSAQKTAKHLTLFDFSLLDVPLSTINVGTSPYRDPFLPGRGHWDPAADRWSAAMTLHEMLTGVRPGYAGAAVDPHAELNLAAERFDAAVRPALAQFFERALDREVERRFASAEKMRAAWNACFIERVAVAVQPSEHPAPEPDVHTGTPSPVAPSVAPPSPEPAPLSAAELAKLSPDTPIGRLGLSVRAQNALDRAGVLRLRELGLLPANRLTAIRGIGSEVGAEVRDLRETWLQSQKAGPLVAKPFFPGYRGADVALLEAGLDASAVSVLTDAGIASLGALAVSPVEQIAALTKRHSLSTSALRNRLSEENRAADQRTRPSTLEGWIEALFGGRSKGVGYMLALFGLASPFEGRLDVRTQEVATQQGCSVQNVYMALGKCRSAWDEHAAFGELLQLVHSVTDELGGGAPLGDAARAVQHRVPFDAAAAAPLTTARAAALIRVVAEVEKDEVDGLRIMRFGDAALWIVTSQQHGAVIRGLASEADALASLKILLSPNAAMDRFTRFAEGTSLGGLAPERLAQLGAKASRDAACSPRGDIYPRHMKPARTLELVHSSNVLKAGLKPDQLQRVLSARFPDAAPLPSRPELDDLLASFKLAWIEETKTYGRPSEGVADTLATVSRTHTSLSPVSTGHRRRNLDYEAIDRAELDERLKIAVERRALRVLGVRSNQAHAAALRLSAHLGVPRVALDQKLIAAMQRCGADKNVPEAAMHKADLRGATGKRWGTLMKLVNDAADQVLAELLPPKQPLLLTHPGLLARYDLTQFIDALVRCAAEDEEAEAIFLLVPAHDVGGIPRINGRMPIRGVLESDAFWIPSVWIHHLESPAA